MDTVYLEFAGILWGTLLLGCALGILGALLYFTLRRTRMRAVSEYQSLLEAFDHAQRDITDLRVILDRFMQQPVEHVQDAIVEDPVPATRDVQKSRRRDRTKKNALDTTGSPSDERSIA